MILENGWVVRFAAKEKALLPWSGRAGLPSETWPSGPNGASKRPARYISLWGDSNLVLDRRA